MTFELPPRRISTARVRPTGGAAAATTSRIAESRSPAPVMPAPVVPLAAARAAPATPGRAAREVTDAGAAGAPAGEHTSQQATDGDAVDRSPKYDSSAVRRQLDPST